MRAALVLVMVMAGTAAAKPTLSEKAHAWSDEFDVGDALPPAVKRARELFGDPQHLDASGGKLALRWYVEDADLCMTIDLSGAGGYVEAWHTKGVAPTAGADYTACHAKLGPSVAVPPIDAPKPYDVDEPAREVMAAFAAGKWQTIFDASHPDLQEIIVAPHGFEHLWSNFPPVTGAYVKLGPPSAHRAVNFGWEVTAPAIFEKGTLEARISFVQGKGGLLLRGIKLTLPPALEHHPAPTEAVPFGKRAVDAVLADDFDKFCSLLSISAEEKLHGHEKELAAALHEILGKLGKVKKVTMTKAGPCEEEGTQCMTFSVVGTKAKTTATITAVYAVSRWEVSVFNLDDP